MFQDQNQKKDQEFIVRRNRKVKKDKGSRWGWRPSTCEGTRRVATIPTIILEIWAKEYNGDQNNGNWFALPKDVQTKILKEKLNSSDYRYFRTAPGRF